MASLLASFEAMPMWQLVLVLTVGTIVLSIVLNVLYQVCVPQSKSLPPRVFHWVPVVGSAVSYGYEPIPLLL